MTKLQIFNCYLTICEINSSRNDIYLLHPFNLTKSELRSLKYIEFKVKMEGEHFEVSVK